MASSVSVASPTFPLKLPMLYRCTMFAFSYFHIWHSHGLCRHRCLRPVKITVDESGLVNWRSKELYFTVFSRYKKILFCMGSAFGSIDVLISGSWHFPFYKNPQTKEMWPLIYRKSTEIWPKFGQFTHSEGALCRVSYPVSYRQLTNSGRGPPVSYRHFFFFRKHCQL